MIDLDSQALPPALPRRVVRAALLFAALAVAAVALASPASAANFEVNGTGDDGDAAIANGQCDTDTTTNGLQCTLRAAIEEANADATADMISFHSSMSGQTIAISSVLLIGGPVSINGCSFNLNSAVPCVGVQAPNLTTDAFQVNSSATNTALRGLAITNANRGVFYHFGATGLQVQNCWFGVKVDGTNEGNDMALELIGNSATIGGTAGASGTAPADRNVFANSTGAGADAAVEVRGDNSQILGNYFGVAPNGTTSAPNDDSIEVSGTTAGGPATGTTIGGSLTNAELQSPACDGRCNVIANGLEEGVDLQGDGGATSPPAGQTTIAGNFVGLRPDGITAAGNASVGVEVGEADDITIGGSTANARNVIGDNGSGISSSPNSLDLVVRNNFIGLNSAGTAAFPDDVRGAVLSGGTFADNRLGGTAANPTDHGVFLDVGVPHIVTGNVFGVGTGGQALGLPVMAIDVGGDATIGGATPAEANTISNTRGAGSHGIHVASGVSTISGNILSSNQGAGITIDNAASGNTVGGDTAGEENVISGSGEDAIRIASGDNNLIDRNRGTGNGTGASDLFIDLNDNGVGNGAGGPNGAVEAPVINTATTTSATGTAEPNADVRVFRRDASHPGRLDAFLGMTSANGVGDWSRTFSAQPGGSFLVATQTQTGGQNTSELSAERVVPAPPPAPGGGSGGTGGTGGSGGTSGSTAPATPATPGSSFLPGPVLPSAAALQAALRGDLAELRRRLARLGIARLLRRRGVTVRGDVLRPGTERFDVFLGSIRRVGPSARTRLLVGKRRFTKAGTAKIRLRLTRRGRRKLRRARRARIRLRATFTDSTGNRTTSSRRGLLKRKKRRRR